MSEGRVCNPHAAVPTLGKSLWNDSIGAWMFWEACDPVLNHCSLWMVDVLMWQWEWKRESAMVWTIPLQDRYGGPYKTECWPWCLHVVGSEWRCGMEKGERGWSCLKRGLNHVGYERNVRVRLDMKLVWRKMDKDNWMWALILCMISTHCETFLKLTWTKLLLCFNKGTCTSSLCVWVLVYKQVVCLYLWLPECVWMLMQPWWKG